MKKTAAILSMMVFPLLMSAQTPDPQPQKAVQAVRAEQPISIDGVLNEAVWQLSGYSDFTQSDPHDGEQPTEKTKVWVAYDDTALYVAACLYDSEPELIKGRLGRRDDMVDSDWFIFAVDPYYDRRTGFQFAVNPANSIVDWTLFNDMWDDTTWDGVWEWKARTNEDGWCVEIRIPYNQLRFPKKEEYTWGVNFRRFIQRNNERDSFAWVSKEDSGYVSKFARLEGINGIKPGRHIEVLPYAVGNAQYSPEQDGNPFAKGQKYLGNAGFDMKVGLKSNVTLDLTFNPDFGQVEVDPAVINLSAYETYYEEKRPFFIEGANIFNAFGQGGSQFQLNIGWAQPNFFYSRRIGRAPQGYVTQPGYVNFPDRSTILGAFKLTGKVGQGWNFGFVNALTTREFAEIDMSGDRFQEEVAPFSYYGVLRGQREFNEGKQGIGFVATSVVRDLNNESLTGLLNKNAFSLALDGWTFLDKDKTWVISGWTGGTQVAGSQEAISRLQNSSLHYFQRPDADHVELDSNATSMTGWGSRFTLSKEKGRFLFHSGLGFLSPGFDPNDLGFQGGASDLIDGHVILAYRWTQPGKIFRDVILFGGVFRSYDFGWNRIWDGALISAEGSFLNYWGFNTLLAYNPDTISNDLTRGGPLVLIPSGYQIDLSMNTDGRKRIILAVSSGLYKRPTEGYRWNGNVSIRWKPSSNVSFSIGPGYSVRESSIQWVTRREDPLMTETFGVRYVFGDFLQKTISSVVTLNWTFTPKLTLQLYLQPFLAVGEYDRFKELARPESYEYNTYGQGDSTVNYSSGVYSVDPDGAGPAPSFDFSNPDFNFKSLRGTVVLRWEYLPGSLIYFVWTQSRADYANPGEFQFGRDMSDLFTAPGDNIFLIKVSYRWNI